MFGVFKGLELMEVATIASAPAHLPDSPAGDWWGDYADYLVNSQNTNGSWTGYGYWYHSMATGWYIVILQATVFPVQVTVDAPDCACDDDGYDVHVTYSVERFEADGTLEILKDDVLVHTVTLTDFTGTATYTHTVGSDSAGTHAWKAVLDVTAGGGGGGSARAEDTDSVDVCETPDVGDIPDQATPFVAFDLDTYLAYSGSLSVNWSASDPGGGWTVTIDGGNVATVTAPEGATDPVEITFTASVEPCSGVTCSGSDTATFTPEIPVPVDVKPTSCRNPLNVGSKGVLPVAILGTEELDVTDIDPASVTLEGVSPIRWSVEDVATPFDGEIVDEFSCTTEGSDGFDDLTLKFDQQAVVAALGDVSDGDVLVLALAGNLTEDAGGTPIVGEDVVVILKKGKPAPEPEASGGKKGGKK